MRPHYCFSLLLCLLSSFSAHALSIPRHDFTPEEQQAALRHNEALFAKGLNSPRTDIYRPAVDYGPVKYVLLGEPAWGGDQDSREARKIIAANLPASVTLVVLVGSEKQVKLIRAQYEKFISADRLIVVNSNDASDGFWARDAFPIPVHLDSAGKLGLVGHVYKRFFQAHDEIAASLGVKDLIMNNYQFVGGNLLTDDEGNCFSVKSERLYKLTAEHLKNYYGCREVLLLPHLVGIGDVDEVIKPLPGKVVLTNQSAYRPLLEARGYKVIMLPQAQGGAYRTYANALLVNEVIFMPSYGVPSDQEAKAVYESFGYKVFLAPSNSTSDYSHGSIHCQTMTYPNIDLELLLTSLETIH